MRRATLFATAHGIYEAELNGVRVGDEELTPGYTEYQHHTQVQSYDVTELLREGDNTLDALLADGWYRGQVGMAARTTSGGPRPRCSPSSRSSTPTARSPSSAPAPTGSGRTSHILVADLIEGQHEDRRLLEPGRAGRRWRWSTTGSTRSPPRRRRRCVPSRSSGRSRSTELRPGVHVVDLGQNINGRVRLTDLGPAGTELVLTHAEWLGPDGDVTTDHLTPDVPFLPEPLPAGMVDRVVSAGVEGDVFEPRFTTHGFQYVRDRGPPRPARPPTT